MNDCIFIGNFSHIPDGQIIFQMCEAECEIVFSKFKSNGVIMLMKLTV